MEALIGQSNTHHSRCLPLPFLGTSGRRASEWDSSAILLAINSGRYGRMTSPSGKIQEEKWHIIILPFYFVNKMIRKSLLRQLYQLFVQGSKIALFRYCNDWLFI